MLKRAVPVILPISGIVLVVLYGFMRVDYAFGVRRLPQPQPYPVLGVLLFSAIVVIHSLIICAILRLNSYRRSWGRAFAAAFLMLVVAVGSMAVPGWLHSPPYTAGYFLWLLCTALALTIAGITSAVGAIRTRNATANT
jgi:fucose 4-O-acetylase-like acetyltransferase